MRIYIVNTETEVGDWLELPVYEDLQEALERLIGGSGGLRVEDADHWPGGWKPWPIDSVDTINELAERIEDLVDDHPQLYSLLEAVCECEASTGVGWLENILDLIEIGDIAWYPGKTLREVAMELVDEGTFGVVPENLEGYIDYDAIAQDLAVDGYVQTGRGVYRLP